ncbi:MAG TPA: matrixin family metalloprotease [Bryobacteraceae bacterium]|nr:matrixin family metalloprotease [Bryobacteraceae bacterium]
MRSYWVAAIAFSMALGAGSAAAADMLTVVISDFAGTPHDILVSAAKEGRHAFHSAGIDTDWIFCDPTRDCLAPDDSLQVRILPRPIASTPVTALGLAATIRCSAGAHCSTSYIFYNRVIRFTDDTATPVDLTLGYVMAHEIGHLLGLEHRPGGIMAAAFSAQDLQRAASGWLFFAHDDVRRLHSSVARSHLAGNAMHRVRLTASRATVAE